MLSSIYSLIIKGMYVVTLFENIQTQFEFFDMLILFALDSLP